MTIFADITAESLVRDEPIYVQTLMALGYAHCCEHDGPERP